MPSSYRRNSVARERFIRRTVTTATVLMGAACSRHPHDCPFQAVGHTATWPRRWVRFRSLTTFVIQKAKRIEQCVQILRDFCERNLPTLQNSSHSTINTAFTHLRPFVNRIRRTQEERRTKRRYSANSVEAR
jgi:hypothetical protein